MNLEQRQALLGELALAKNQAFSAGGPYISIIQALILRLKELDKQDKPFFKEFATELKNSLFESGANISGLDLNEFLEQEAQPEVSPIEEEAPTSVNVSNKTYFEALSELLVCLKDELPTLKNYFFVRLHSANSSNYIPLLIYESGCFYQSVRKKLQDQYGDCLCKSIEEIKEDIEKNLFPDSSFIAVLVLSTKVNEKEKVDARQELLNVILGHFEEVYHLSPKSLTAPKQSDVISTNNVDSLLDEIRYVTSSFLTNAELSNEEEKIIKKLFQDANCPILEYKVLKGGKSGSKVIEIRPKKTYASDYTKRFIVKFGYIDEKKKIALEANRFGEHIEHYSIPNYQKRYEANSMVEAIKYIYASDNGIRTSHSFSDILNDTENEFHQNKNQIIEDIFSSNPFELWKQSSENGTHKIADLYKDYIKPEKFFDNVRRIKGITDLAQEHIYANFNKIFDLEIDTKTKVCHGDLHSENFFKDQNEIYLIDFGFTERRHAIIDHASLECSIKFKHIPFYIDLKILEEIEEQLLSENSFNASFEVTTARKDILEYYELIRIIRTNSLSYVHDANSRLEYLISLFVLTCRHAQYNDLNQLYALKSAETLGNRLVQLLS